MSPALAGRFLTTAATREAQELFLEHFENFQSIDSLKIVLSRRERALLGEAISGPEAR